MTPGDAQTLLDMARQGVQIPEEVITWALTVTGDAVQSNWAARQDVLDFVQSLRQEGLL